MYLGNLSKSNKAFKSDYTSVIFLFIYENVY